MDEWAEHCQGARPDIDADFRAQKRLIAELTAIATAVAVNSVPDLENHLTAARDIGAPPEQIHVAIEIARKIKRVAEETGTTPLAYRRSKSWVDLHQVSSLKA